MKMMINMVNEDDIFPDDNALGLLKVCDANKMAKRFVGPEIIDTLKRKYKFIVDDRVRSVVVDI